MTQVRAIDKDAEDGPGPNGQVTYSIVSQHNKFTIDRNTGDLYTNAVRTKNEGRNERVGALIAGNGLARLRGRFGPYPTYMVSF